MATAKLNAKTDTPTTKTQITKGFMLDYVKINGSEEDKAWFKALVNENKVEKDSKLPNGKAYETIDIKAVRNAFCDRFFPQLNQKKKANSFFDDVNSL